MFSRAPLSRKPEPINLDKRTERLLTNPSSLASSAEKMEFRLWLVGLLLAMAAVAECSLPNQDWYDIGDMLSPYMPRVEANDSEGLDPAETLMDSEISRRHLAAARYSQESIPNALSEFPIDFPSWNFFISLTTRTRFVFSYNRI